MVSQKVKIIGTGVVAGIILGAAPFVLKIEAAPKTATAASSTTSSFSDAQKTELNTLIKDFILNNPDVLMESVNRQREQAAKAQEEQGAKALAEYKEFLFNNPEMPDIGPKNADITIVEFFDYNCGYCKRALEAVQAVIDKDKNVRFVFVELPILSDQSRAAAEVAMASHLQGKYFEFHRDLMHFNGPKTEENMMMIAGKLGLDTARLLKDAKSEKVQTLLAKKMEAANKLAITGTPAFILGDQIIRGFIPADAMQTMIKDPRAKKG
jgi:protein-disulfide isomerase